MVSLEWHLYQYHPGCAISAFHQQKVRLIELQEPPMYCLTQSLLRCCFAICQPGGPAERARKAVSLPPALAALLQQEVQLSLLHYSQ